MACEKTYTASGLSASSGGIVRVEVLRRHNEHAPEDPLSKIQYLDFKTYLPGDILTKVDRASMAHALEVRVPILDHTLVEWLATLPPNYKLRGREGKYIFKKALEPYLPNNVLYRPQDGICRTFGDLVPRTVAGTGQRGAFGSCNVGCGLV
jgi:asparagine synthase (glutamine-hydrolysing)